MTKKDIAVIKKRLQADKRSALAIRGCYVDPTGKILSSFTEPVSTMPSDEYEKYCSFFKKVVGGKQGKNLLEVTVPSQDPEDPMFQRLTGLVAQDEDAIKDTFQAVITAILKETGDVSQSVEDMQAAPNMLILLLADHFDGKYKHGDDKDMEETTFTYALCAICPVKQGKESMNYVDGSFMVQPAAWTVMPPTMGFMYPTYESGVANVSAAALFTKDANNTHADLQMDLFGFEAVPAALEQAERFSSILQESLSEECSMELVQAVTDSVKEVLSEDSASQLSGGDFGNILASVGVSEEKIELFTEKFNETFGDEKLQASNLLETKDFTVETPKVHIKVSGEDAELVQTRVIDGKRYILILADGNVEANGIEVVI